MLKVSIVFNPNIIPIWEKCLPYIEAACSFSEGRVTAAGTLDRALKDKVNLWIAYDDDTAEIVGCMITRINHYDAVSALTVEELGGDRFDEWIDQAHAGLVIAAEHEGCKLIECIGRKGWVRKMQAYGWEPKFTTVQLKLE